MTAANPDLTRRLRTVGARVRSEVANRDRLIVEAVGRGMSYREVATYVGMSHTGVAKVVKREARVE